MRLIPHSIKWRIQFWHGILFSMITIGLLYGFYTYEKQMQLDQIDSKLMMFYYRMLPALAQKDKTMWEMTEPPGYGPNNEHRRRSPFPGPPGSAPPGRRPPGRAGPPGPGRAHVPPERRASNFVNHVQQEGVYSAVWTLEGKNLFKSTNAPPSHVFPKVEVIDKLATKPAIESGSNVPQEPVLASNTQVTNEPTETASNSPNTVNATAGSTKRKQPTTNEVVASNSPNLGSNRNKIERHIRSLEGPEIDSRMVEEAGESFLYLSRKGYREIIQKATKHSLIVVGTPMGQYETKIAAMKWNLIAIGGGVIFIGLMGGAYLASDAIRPIRLISTTAERISKGQSQQRIKSSETDSELGRLTLVLNRAFDQLDQMVQKQVRFTADASHELRTPITIIQCQTQAALQKHREEHEYRRALLACQRAGTRMNGLIASLLELARADSGRMDLVLQRINLAPFLTQAVQFVEPLTEQCDVEIDHMLKDTFVEIDTERMNQVLTNLLTNAIQHNPTGKKVLVECDNENEAAIIRVRDCGKGIPEDELPYLFERFQRGDASRSRKSGGYGLGLSICKAIVEAHGGTISVTSVIDQGSTFVVRLPLCTEISPDSEQKEIPIRFELKQDEQLN